MPRYDYLCKECEKNFFIIVPITDNRENVLCESCQSKNVSRIYNATILKSSRVKEVNPEESVKEVRKHNHHNCQHHGHEHNYGEHCSPEDEYL